MKALTLAIAMGLTTTVFSLDAGAVKPGRPEALTRGLSENHAAPVETEAAKRLAVQIGRPEALTRGLGQNMEAPNPDVANGIAAGQKPGRPEYHTRGIFCSHRGARG